MKQTILFEQTMEANKKYVALVNANDSRQLEQLEICRVLMDNIRKNGLMGEYKYWCEKMSLIAK